MKRILLGLLIAAAGLCAASAQIAPAVQLLTNASSSGAPKYWRGGVGTFTVVGTFSGATVTLEYLGPDNVTYVAAGTNTTCTSACNGVFYLGQGTVEAVVSGGSPSGLYASITLVQASP